MNFTERYQKEEMKAKEVKKEILKLIDLDYESSFNKIKDYLEELKERGFIVGYNLLNGNNNEFIIWSTHYESAVPFPDSYDFKRKILFSDDIYKFSNKDWWDKNIIKALITLKNADYKVDIFFEDETTMEVNGKTWKNIIGYKAPERGEELKKCLDLTDKILWKAKKIIEENSNLKNYEKKSDWIGLPVNKEWTIFDMAVGQFLTTTNGYLADLFMRKQIT